MIVLSALLQFACLGSVTGPDKPEPTPQYWGKVEVFYYRDPVKITTPHKYGERVNFYYELYDPKAAKKSQNDNQVGNYWRYGAFVLEKISENKFHGFLEEVYVQVSSSDKKHRIYYRDTECNYQFSCDGLIIDQAIELEISGYQLLFNMPKMSTGKTLFKRNY